MGHGKRNRAKDVGLYVAGGLAAAICLGCIAWFVNLLVMRTSFKSDRLELAGSFTKAYYDRAELQYGGETFAADRDALDYFLGFLTDNQTMVLRRGGREPDADTIYLYLPDTTLCLTPDENGLDTCVFWELGGKSYRYTLRGVVDFDYLARYLINVKNRVRQAEP